ncbi:kinase-like domain-containing protein [Jimgerdemannia flammicorona]|uniref:Kinase-like domain-containing protein n=2 Tax=Jimgerdemannia flammicorona TaxID=994334 RepID=A0A433PK11_9FUNG|nr:kinase-like domain-containing protein [Jimgerdemannia flammicorona]RUS17795.1 kinase-like domain-containing protein [Jimgerdemannia flammicorona]
MSEVNWSELAPSKLDTVIGGSVKLLEVLGNGSYGCLFLGQTLDLTTHADEYIAVKALSKRDLDDRQLALQRQEFDIHASLRHPNVVALHRVIEDADTIYMVMELCEGDLFEAIVRDQQQQASGLSSDDDFIRAAFGQVLDAVEHMHARGVYHRDIKPENVLVHYPDSVEGSALTFKLADFGLATRDSLSSEFGCGSTSYLAPEHFADDTYIGSAALYSSAASDVWSLGILLLALIFGRNPWQEASLADPVYAQYRRNPHVLKQLFPISDDVLSLLRLALAVDPSRRPSVRELRRAFSCVRSFTESSSSEHNIPPVDIPAAQVAPSSGHLVAQNKNVHRNSCDSGVFVSSSSWSDLEDDDSAFEGDPFGEVTKPIVSLANMPFAERMVRVPLEDDEAIFVHTEEKDSWWM